MLFDDVRHAFGSVQHDTLAAILRLLNFPSHLIDILMNAATGATLHMGGENGIIEALAKFRAGIAQGCPMSALLFCILLELRFRMVLHDIPKPRSKCGDFGHVAYMDDTTYLLDQVSDIQQLLSNLYQTGILTHLHTSTAKLVVAVVHRQGLQVIFDKLDILAGGSTAPIADGKMYIRLLGRHAMPHVFHTNDFIKMMSASRKASIVLRYVRLPANYPILMYNASAGGAHRWLGGIRPPPPGLMRLSDHPAASALRATANWSPIPSALFLQPLEAGWTGIQSTTVVMLLQFLLNYIKQVNHPNPIARYSVMRSLWRARQGFSKHMSCTQTPLSIICPAHSTDHSRFLNLMHSMDIEIHFPACIMEQEDDIPMYKANHSVEANQIHAWM